MRGSARSWCPAPWMRRISARPSAAATRSRASLTGISRSSVPCPMSRRRGGHVRDRLERVDRHDVASQLLGREQVLLVAHDAGDLHRAAELLGRPAPGLEVRRGGEGGHPPDALVGRGDGQGQRRRRIRSPRARGAGRPRSTRSRIVVRSARHWDAEKVPVLPPTPDSVPVDHDPARLVGEVLGQLGQETGRLTAHAHRARQSVHEDQDVARRRARGRGRNAQVEQ